MTVYHSHWLIDFHDFGYINGPLTYRVYLWDNACKTHATKLAKLQLKSMEMITYYTHKAQPKVTTYTLL